MGCHGDRLAGGRGARRALGPAGGRGPASTLCAALVALAVLLSAARARAQVYPSGSLGAVLGAQAGTSGAYTALGVGAAYGLTAAWQPIDDEQRIGWGARWTVLFGYFPNAGASAVSDALRLVELDLVARLRVAPTLTPGRYLTLGVGASLLRANEPIMDKSRAFIGPVATLGYEYYALGAVLLGVDLRYGLIESGPASIGLLVSVGTAL